MSQHAESPRSIAVIGAGFHATTNILPSCLRAGLAIDAIATRDVQRSADALLRFGSTGQAFGSAESLLADAGLASVAVVAQPRDQAALALQAIRAGKNVFVDKPLGWTADEARLISDEADARGVTLMVGFMKRYAPAYEQLQELLAGGELGRLRSFHLAFGCDSTPFCADAEEFVKLAAIHVIDLVRWLFGEVVDVTVASNGSGTHVALAILLRFESGVVGTLDLSGLPGYSSESEHLRVSGDEGYAIVEDLVSLTVHRTAPDDQPSWKRLTERTTVFTPAESAMSGTDRDLYIRGFVGEMAHFAAAVETGALPRSSGRDNVLTMALCDRIVQFPPTGA